MKRALARRLADVHGFESPVPELEQYATPTALAANLVHLADLQGDLRGTVVDLGTGTGMLALAAATRAPARVVGVELDRDALAIAAENEARVDPARSVDWVQGDATRPPLATTDATVVMNPPFGAQHGHRGADRDFLDAARDVGTVSYSVHNQGSQAFVESYAADHDGHVTHAFAAEFPVERQFEFHTSDRDVLDVEVFRVEWPDYS